MNPLLNVDFISGNTEALKHTSRKDIPYRGEKASVFEIIDGGAVVISGNSSVKLVSLLIFLHIGFKTQ